MALLFAQKRPTTATPVQDMPVILPGFGDVGDRMFGTE
jgi:uracil phosphoribosyltransferase